MTNNYEIKDYEVQRIHYGAKRHEYIEVVFDDEHMTYDIYNRNDDYDYYEQEW